MALIDKLSAIADSIRTKTGLTGKLTLDQMVQNVDGLDVMPETVILVDEDGVEIPAVFTDEVVNITATPNDIRLGTTAITNAGIVEGEKVIPSYVTAEGFKLIPSGSNFVLRLSNGAHAYTKMQAIFCPFNISLSESVGADRVTINGKVYPVRSVIADAEVTVSEPDVVDFGVVNTTDVPCLIRYFTYKEVY